MQKFQVYSTKTLRRLRTKTSSLTELQRLRFRLAEKFFELFLRFFAFLFCFKY